MGKKFNLFHEMTTEKGGGIAVILKLELLVDTVASSKDLDSTA